MGSSLNSGQGPYYLRDLKTGPNSENYPNPGACKPAYPSQGSRNADNLHDLWPVGGFDQRFVGSTSKIRVSPGGSLAAKSVSDRVWDSYYTRGRPRAMPKELRFRHLQSPAGATSEQRGDEAQAAAEDRRRDLNPKAPKRFSSLDFKFEGSQQGKRAIMGLGGWRASNFPASCLKGHGDTDSGFQCSGVDCRPQDA